MSNKKFSDSSFSQSDLPKNRKELFFDIFKLHFWQMVKIGFICLAFLLPFLIVNVLKDISYISAYSEGKSNSTVLIIFSIIEIPCLILFFVFVAGIGKVDKEYCWLEPVFFKDDFFDGIKDNVKPLALLGFLTGLINLLFNIVYVYSSKQSNFFIAAIPFGFAYVVFYPIVIHTILINCVYTNTFSANFKLGLFLYSKHFLSSILFAAFLLTFNLMNFIHFINPTMLIIKYGILALIIVFIAPFIFLIIYLNEMKIFDLRFNKEKFPQLVNKGLHQE